MAFELSDDGTMDTVLVCVSCGAEARYTFDGDGEESYDAFVEWAIEDAEGDHDHECPDRPVLVVSEVSAETAYGRTVGYPFTVRVF
jgi:hypothetical protein